MIRANVNQLKRLYAFVKENIVTIIVIVAVVLGCLSLALIITDKDKVDVSEDVTYQHVVNQRFGISNVKTLNPIISKDRDTYYIDKLVYNGLFKQDNDMGVSMDLASNYTVNPGAGEVTVTLKGGIRFHDGSRLTADDVAYTHSYIVSSGKGGMYYDIAKKIDSISVLSSNKLKVYFKNPNDASLDYLTFPILNEGDGNSDSNFRPNGTGQYRISSIQKGKYIRLKPNEDYFGDVAENKIYCEVFPKTTVLRNLLSSYEVTALLYKDFDIDEISESSDITRVYVPSNNMEYIGFNFKNKSLANVRLRKAICYALDLQDVTKNAYGSTALINDSVYFPGYYGTENTGDPYPVNFDKAINLISKMNLIDHDKDGYLDDIDGNTIEINILVNKNDSNRMLVATYISECLEDLQIKNEISAQSWNSYKSSVNRGNFDILIGGYELNSHDKLDFLFDKKNNIGYDNEQVRELVKKLSTCTSIETTKENYMKLKELLKKDVPYYCICYKQFSLLGSPKMDFAELPNFDNVYRGVNTWEFEKRIKQ